MFAAVESTKAKLAGVPPQPAVAQRSIWYESSLSALSVHVSVVAVAEFATAVSPVGTAGRRRSSTMRS